MHCQRNPHHYHHNHPAYHNEFHGLEETTHSGLEEITHSELEEITHSGLQEITHSGLGEISHSLDTPTRPVGFAELKVAAEQDSWPGHLAGVTDWDLLSLDQEAELVSLAYDKRNWNMLEKMFGCGIGSHCIGVLLGRCDDVSDPHGWPEFAERLFWTQLPTYSRQDNPLSAGLLTQLLLIFLDMHRQSTFERFWDYVPDCMDMLCRELGQENAEQFVEVVVTTYHFVMPIQTIRPDKLTRKWRIIYKALVHVPTLRAHFLDYLHQPGKTSSEARALIYNALQHGDLMGLNILRQLQNIMPVARSFIDEQFKQLAISSAAFGGCIF